MDNIDGLIGRLPQFRILWVKALCCNYPEISEPTLILETGLSNRRPPHCVMLKKSIDLNSLVICDFLNPWLFLQPDIPSRCDETWVMRDYEAMHRAIEMQMKRICLRNFSATFMYTICWMCLIYLIHFETLLWNVVLCISNLWYWPLSMKHRTNNWFGKAKNLEITQILVISIIMSTPSTSLLCQRHFFIHSFTHSFVSIILASWRKRVRLSTSGIVSL